MTTKSFETFTQILQYVVRYFKYIVMASVILILLSGIYQVESNEVAIVLRFGRIVGNNRQEQIKQPGLHYSLPFFIDEVVKIPVQTVLEKEIVTHFAEGASSGGGESTQSETTTTTADSTDLLLQISEGMDDDDPAMEIETYVEEVAAAQPQDGYLLTGDNNVVLIKAMLKYTIEDAAQYALYFSDTASVIDGVVSGEMTRLISHMDLDSVLTSGKAQLAAEITNSSQRILDNLKSGVMITSLELTDIVPPTETKAYFEQVVSASVDKESAIQTAQQQASSLVLAAEAEAKSYRQTAIQDQTLRLTSARNDMAEFYGLYDQYVIDPQIIINGTFRERVNAVLAQSGGVIVVPEGQTSPVVILP